MQCLTVLHSVVVRTLLVVLLFLPFFPLQIQNDARMVKGLILEWTVPRLHV